MFCLSRPKFIVPDLSRFIPHAFALVGLVFIAGCGAQTYSSADRSAPHHKARVAHGATFGHLGSGSASYNYHRIFARPRENYASVPDNAVRAAADNPLSTFSIDVDTGSYANVRRFLNRGRLPVRDAVRVEEMINYFAYGYAAPETRAKPFKVTTEVAPTPWNRHTHLLQIGLKAFDVPKTPPPGLQPGVSN